jgi:DNA (cytosine-5)-methyltransferase 1
LQNRYTQVGNAVPVVLGETAARVIVGRLEGKVERNAESQGDLFNGEERFRIVYVKSHIRTRRWFSGGQAQVWDANPSVNARHSAPVTQRKERAIGRALTTTSS